MPSILPLLYLAPGAGRLVVCLFYLPFTLRCCLSLNCQSVRPPVHLSRRSLFPQPAWIRLWDVYEVSIVSIVDGSRRRWWRWWFCTCVTWWFLALPGYLYLQFRYDRLTRLLTLLISYELSSSVPSRTSGFVNQVYISNGCTNSTCSKRRRAQVTTVAMT